MALRKAIVALMGLWLAGCASTPPTPEMIANNDPYEPTNRDTLQFNGMIDRYFVIPTVALYFVLVPEGGRRAVPFRGDRKAAGLGARAQHSGRCGADVGEGAGHGHRVRLSEGGRECLATCEAP